MTGLRHELRVLHALMLREMITRYGNSRLGYLWAVLEPVGFIALLSVVFGQIAHAPPMGKSFVLFYATGYVAFHWVNDIGSVTGRSVHVNRPLLAFPAVTPLDTILARAALQSLTGLAAAVAIFAGSLMIFADQVTLAIRPLATAFGLAALLGLAIGTFNAVAFARSRTWELTWGLISRPLFLVSCVFFSFWSMPGFVREVLWWNPLVHIVGLVRAGFYPAYDGGHLSPAYVATVALALLLAGLAGLRMGACREAAL